MALSRKKIILSVFFILWTCSVASLVAGIFFPYDRFFSTLFRNAVWNTGVTVFLANPRIGPTGARATRAGVSRLHAERPLVELEDVTIHWNPLSIIKGMVDMSGTASAYGGHVVFDIRKIPVYREGTPTLLVRFSDINLVRYREQDLPWVKDLSGLMNGLLEKELTMSSKPSKGRFNLTLRNGEIRELQIKGLPRLNMPFRVICVEGRIDGEKTEISNFSVNAAGMSLKGSGCIEGSEPYRNIDLKLSCEGTSALTPVTGKGVIAIAGALPAPEVMMAPDAKKGRPR